LAENNNTVNNGITIASTNTVTTTDTKTTTSTTSKNIYNSGKDVVNNDYNINNNNNDNIVHSSMNDGSRSDSNSTNVVSYTNSTTENNDKKNDNSDNSSDNREVLSSKRIIIVGIPGVGKTSVICSAVKSLTEKGQNVKVVVFGTEMFEEAKITVGIKNRDELRKLSVKDQRRLQDMTAKRIAEMQDSIVIVDTHIFVRTGEGYYYPGLPMRLLEIIKPTSFVIIVADAAEIVNRRKRDTTRARDDVSIDEVQYEIDISKLMVATCSVLTGAPFIIIANNDNKIDEAASCLTKVLLPASG
jgi:adenylate kinase